MATPNCHRCGLVFEALRSDAKWCPACFPEVQREKSRKFDQVHQHPCAMCGKLGDRRSKLCPECYRESRGLNQKGERNPAWKGGRILGKDGYYRLRTERADRKTPYELEHRVLWEQAFGPLPEWHIIHHLNGIKSDNRLENLAAMSRADHHTKHAEPYEARIRALEAALAALGVVM